MKKNNAILISIVVLLLVFASCKKTNNEPANTPNNFDQLFSSLYKNQQFNGAVLILKDGKIVYQAALGKSNFEKNDTLNLNSSFRLASVSKQFTAMGIMILKEQEKLSFDQNINDIFPDIPYDNITIRHLLNHTSGIPDYERLLNKFWKPSLDKDDPNRFISGNDDIIEMLIEKAPPIRFNPGDKYEYSNTGYVLLASIIEKVSRQSFGDFLHEFIFNPVQMNHTKVYNYQPTYDPEFPLRVFGFKRGLYGKDFISTDAHYINFAQGDGGVYSSIGDMLKWDRYLYQNKVVLEKTLEEAFSPVLLNNGEISNYGFGWGIGKSVSGKKVVSHSGGWVGFRTYFYREIEENNCFILLTNDSNTYLREIETQIKNILHEKPYKIPKLNISIVLQKHVYKNGIESALNSYSELKSSGKYEINEYNLNNCAYSFLKLNKINEAIELYKLSLSEFPNSAYTNKYIGQAYLKNNDTVNALIHYKKSYESDSSFTDSYELVEKLSK